MVFREYSQFRKSHHHQSVPKLENLPIKDSRFQQHANAILYPHEYNSNNPDNSMYMRSEGYENGDGNTDNQNDAYPYNANEYDQAQQRQSANDTGFDSNNPFEPSHDQVYMGDMSYRSKSSIFKNNLPIVGNSNMMSSHASNMYGNYPMNPQYPQMQMAQPSVSNEHFQMMVQNYESVLQSLNHEFKNSLEQNRILQEEMTSLQQNQIRDRRVIEDLQKTLEEKEGSDQSQTLIQEK